MQDVVCRVVPQSNDLIISMLQKQQACLVTHQVSGGGN